MPFLTFLSGQTPDLRGMASLLNILVVSLCFTHCTRLYCSATAIPQAPVAYPDDVQQEPVIPGISSALRDTLEFRAVYNNPDVSLSARYCQVAGAAAALREGNDAIERQSEYHQNDITIEIPRLAGDLEPKRESVVWTIYYALETMAQQDNSFRAAEFSLRARVDGQILAIVRFKRRVTPQTEDDVVVRAGAGAGADDSDFNKTLDAANITSGLPGAWSPEWSQKWVYPEPGFHPAQFYMALVTMPCILVTTPGNTPWSEFDTFSYKYKIIVTDETQPPLVYPLESRGVLRMGYQALFFAVQREARGENLGLLTLTLKLGRDGQHVADFVLRYPALDAQSTPEVAGAATVNTE